MSVKPVPLTRQLPAPEEIARRIGAYQDELAALRKLLRVSVTAHRAEQARQRRRPQKGVPTE